MEGMIVVDKIKKTAMNVVCTIQVRLEDSGA